MNNLLEDWKAKHDMLCQYHPIINPHASYSTQLNIIWATAVSEEEEGEVRL